MIYKKWFNDTLISGQSKDVLSLTADNNLKNKSIIAEVIYKSVSTKSNPFSLTIKDKPTPPPSKLSTPSNGGNNSKPSTPNTPTNSTIGNNGLVEDLGLDWWVYAAIAGGVVILVAIGITTWLLLKKKNSKKKKKVVKTQQVVRTNNGQVKTITTSRTTPPNKGTSMPQFKGPLPTSKSKK